MNRQFHFEPHPDRRLAAVDGSCVARRGCPPMSQTAVIGQLTAVNRFRAPARNRTRIGRLRGVDMRHRARVLYAEDDDDVRELTAFALIRDGFEVCAHPCGESLLSQAAALRAELVLLDVCLPGIDGIETLRRLRALPGLAGTPAVFLTASRQPDELAALRAAGACDIVHKPFDAATLGARLRRQLDAARADEDAAALATHPPVQGRRAGWSAADAPAGDAGRVAVSGEGRG
jgi:two-component system, OmpR family, response regulator